MNVAGKIVVVTGGGSGIGRALAERCAASGASHVVVADIADDARQVARSIGGTATRTDVGVEADVLELVERVEGEIGPIGLFCSNAGVLERDGDPYDAASALEAAWERSWKINVMAHVYAARAALPFMRARKEGWFLNTISAAGLLSQIGASAYSTTKHAALGFAESLAIAHKDDGIGVSVLCPQAVDTPMVAGRSMAGADIDGVASPAHVAACAIDGVEQGLFLILPHPEVRDYFTRKAADYERWIGGMAKLRRGVLRGST
jgi:NAD(P)-dependent dehydrogenase (short-subunit alcohol dehydrogenase family)